MIPLDHNTIVSIRNEKRDLEVEVAKTLYRYFNQRYLHRIQKLVRQLVYSILGVPKQNALNPWLSKKRSQFLMFQRGVEASVNGLRKFLGREMFWTLDNCSDMIRLFGEIVEDHKMFGIDDYHVQQKTKLRPEPTFLKVGDGKPVKNGGWGDNFGHRHRGNRAESEQTITGEPFVNIATITRGIDKFQFLPKSVIAAIDRTFGLRPEGGDISGTTTDSIYALRWAGMTAGLTQDLVKAIQILPLVTMVPQGHHTMVECAYPLSRHGIIDYHIGYYTTLAPKHSPGLYNGVLGPLEKRSKHVLVWGRGRGEQGVQMDQQDEITAFKKLARVLSAYGFCVAGGLNDFGQALNVVRTFSPNLLAGKLANLRSRVGLSELERKFRQFGLPRR